MNSKTVAASSSLDLLDRTAIAYLTLPLLIFAVGWFELWAAVPLVACMAYGQKPLIAPLPTGGARLPLTRLQLTVALAVGCGWTLCGGSGHWMFANADWHLRDAVLHDLVVGAWPVGYGAPDGQVSLLRAPIAYYLPPALIGKWGGLFAAHAALAAWTAIGATLFLLQVLSLTPSRMGIALTVAAVIVLFSGLDVIGSALDVPHFLAHWDVARHLEWWAGSYQYSSMTTQLFWVPNHALGGWLMMGLLCRAPGGAAALDSMLPILIVAVALWSPLVALGLVPFVLWEAIGRMARERSRRLLDPRVWAPALLVGIAVAAYLALDAGRIPKGWVIGRNGTAAADIARDVLRQVKFFLLEAGFIGIAVLAIRRSSRVVLALVILALLPLVSFGAANDFVMRASIPSLTVLAVGATLAFSESAWMRTSSKKVVLGCLLAVGAVTPLQEFARAALLPSWPIDLQATVIGAACGSYPPHYVARLGEHAVERILLKVHPLPRGAEREQACKNPASVLMKQRGL